MNQGVYQSCHDFLGQLLNYLSEKIADGEVNLDDTGAVSQTILSAMDTAASDIRNWETTKAVATAVQAAAYDIGDVYDSPGNLIPEEKYEPWHVWLVILRPLAFRYLENSNGEMSINSRRLRKILRNLEVSFTRGILRRHLAFLENFDSEVEQLRFSRNLWIAPIGEPDRKRLKFYEQFMSTSRSQAVSQAASWGIYYQHRVLPYEAESSTASMFRDVELALRLAGPEPVGYRADITYSAEPAWGLALEQAGVKGEEIKSGDTYVLNPEKAKAALRWWRILSGNPIPNQNQVAIRRFHQTYLQRGQEDQLIDSWIALENIFMPDGDPREATYRMALRVAYFLGRNGNDRQEIDRNIRQSYRLRSDIVHGRSFDNQKMTAALNHTVDYLRAALIKIIRTKKPLDVESLDTAVRLGKRPS